jgi:hypothetical protein
MIRAHRLSVENVPQMRHALTLVALSVLVSLGAAACDDQNTINTPTTPSPTVVTDSFSGTLTVNGAQTHPFTVSRAGGVTAQIMSLSTDGATISLSLGTWNGAACQLIIANDAAALSTSVVGTATTAGQFCARVSDAGRLTGPVDYAINVSHY